ncbi:MAG: response regulator [Proteobacteria bacterium]|nr:response regulator [Pseudomonadota bacterium]
MKRKVLVIDDDSELTGLVVTVLKWAGYDARAASGAAEGLSRVHEDRPDLVLLDYHLGNEDAGQLYRRLREDPSTRSTRVVACSAEIDPFAESRRERRRIRALAKPFTANELLAAVHDALGEAGEAKRLGSMPRPAC